MFEVIVIGERLNESQHSTHRVFLNHLKRVKEKYEHLSSFTKMVFQLLQIAGEGAGKGIANVDIGNVLIRVQATDITFCTVLGKGFPEGDGQPCEEGFLELLDGGFRDDNSITVNHIKKIHRDNGEVRASCSGLPDVLS